jgi:hypothetical protein
MFINIGYKCFTRTLGPMNNLWDGSLDILRQDIPLNTAYKSACKLSKSYGYGVMYN